MSGDEAKYEMVDPQAKGFDAVQRAFANQVAYCRDNGAPVTATICQALYDLLENDVLPAWKSSRGRWLSMMRSAIVAGSAFTGQRMIREYQNIYETFGM